MSINDAERRRLAAILGMLGSDQQGERDAAALHAEAFRRKHRLTWAELLSLPAVQEEAAAWPSPAEAAAAWNAARQAAWAKAEAAKPPPPPPAPPVTVGRATWGRASWEIIVVPALGYLSMILYVTLLTIFVLALFHVKI